MCWAKGIPGVIRPLRLSFLTKVGQDGEKFYSDVGKISRLNNRIIETQERSIQRARDNLMKELRKFSGQEDDSFIVLPNC